MWFGINIWIVNYVVSQVFFCNDEFLLEQDVAIYIYEIGNSFCYDGFVSVNFYNIGSELLIVVIIEFWCDGEFVDIYDWIGELFIGVEVFVFFENVDLQLGLNIFFLVFFFDDDDFFNNEVLVFFVKVFFVFVNFDFYI